MRVLLKMCLCGSVRGSTSKPPCSLSDITAQQSMTGAKATSRQGYVENIIHLPAPLFILSTQRVWLLFHKWRRHTAVITSHCSPHPFCAVWLLHAGSDWKSLLSWVTLFLVLNCVIHEASSGFLSREALKALRQLYTLWHPLLCVSVLSFVIMHVKETRVTAASEKRS